MEGNTIMSKKITVILPNQMKTTENDAVKAEVAAVQKYLDETDLKLDKPTLYFVALKGIYTHISRKMELTAVFINCHVKAISELAATIKLTTDDKDMEIAKTKIGLPTEFVGDFQPNQALLFNLSIPVRGLTKDRIFEAFQFKAELENIQIAEKAEPKED